MSIDPAYLVEGILPRNEVHLIAGPSGAGKTRFLFGCLQEWQERGTWLGFPCAPYPKTLYVACDRSEASLRRTMESFPRLKLDAISIRGQSGFLAEFAANPQGVKHLIIDGMGTLTPDGKLNDYAVVASFLTNWGKVLARESITNTSLVHATKVKQNEKFLNPRQRIAGSVAWAAFSETIFCIDPIDPENAQSKRNIFIGPRNAPEQNLIMDFKDGILVPSNYGVIEALTSDEIAILEIVKSGVTARMEIVRAAHLNLGFSPSTTDRILRALVEQCIIRKSGFGLYQIVTEKQ